MSVYGPLGATPDTGTFELRPSATAARRVREVPHAREVAGSRVGLIGLAGLVVTGLVISVAAARTDLLLPESVRPAPGWLAGAFGNTGLNIGNIGVVLVFLAMLASYVATVLTANRLSGRAVLMTIAALHAVILLAPPLLSTDVFSYQAYARIGAVYGTNPYLFGPHAIALDSVFPYIGAKWSYIPTAYGPLFTMLSYALAPVSIAASALAYKAVATLASLAIVALVWNCARLRGVNPVRAVALVGCNPLLVVYGVGGGHNDLLMLAATMAGVYLLLAQRERAAGGAIVAGAAVKLTGALVLPFALAATARRGAPRRPREVAIGAAAVTVAVAVGSLALFGTGPLHLLSTLRQTQSEGDWHSISGFVSTLAGFGSISHAVALALEAAFAAVTVWLVVKVWRREIDWIDGAALATLAMIVTAGALLPWYVAWMLPLAALGRDQRVWRSSVALTVLVLCIQLLGYVPGLHV